MLYGQKSDDKSKKCLSGYQEKFECDLCKNLRLPGFARIAFKLRSLIGS